MARSGSARRVNTNSTSHLRRRVKAPDRRHADHRRRWNPRRSHLEWPHCLGFRKTHHPYPLFRKRSRRTDAGALGQVARRKLEGLRHARLCSYLQRIVNKLFESIAQLSSGVVVCRPRWQFLVCTWTRPSRKPDVPVDHLLVSDPISVHLWVGIVHSGDQPYGIVCWVES